MLSTVFIKYIVKADVNMNKMLSLALRKMILLIKKKNYLQNYFIHSEKNNCLRESNCHLVSVQIISS